MKTLILLSLLAAVSSQADIVRGYFRSNGTQVQTYVRTPANDSVLDNRSYRGYPSQQRALTYNEIKSQYNKATADEFVAQGLNR